MAKSKARSPVSDPLRDAIAKGQIPLVVLEKETGVNYRNIARFLGGEGSLRLDVVDTLADFFRLELKPARKARTRVTKKHAEKPQRQVQSDWVTVSVHHRGKYMGTKPRSFRFGGKEHKVHPSTWTDLLVDFCKLVYKDNQAEFADAACHILGPRRSYFSTEKKEYPRWKPIPGSGISVDTNLSANNIKSLCDTIMFQFGYGDKLSVDI